MKKLRFSSYKVGLNIKYFLIEWEGWTGKYLARVMHKALHTSAFTMVFCGIVRAGPYGAHDKPSYIIATSL